MVASSWGLGGSTGSSAPTAGIAKRVGTKPAAGSVQSGVAVPRVGGPAAGEELAGRGEGLTEGVGGAVDGEGRAEAAGTGVEVAGTGRASVSSPLGIISAISATTTSAAARTMSRGRRERDCCGGVVTHQA